MVNKLHIHKEVHSNKGHTLRELILGGQDGLVNVLGIILALATATQDVRIVIIAGLAATFAESISMAAVAYTSSKAMREFYNAELEREKREMKEVPEKERKEIMDIFYKKGFRGPLLAQAVRKITSNKKIWLNTMMEEELHLYPEKDSPLKQAFVVGIAAIVGSIIPIMPFFFLDTGTGIIFSITISTIALFATGMVKNKITVGRPIKGGIEMALIGMVSAIIGYGIGTALGVVMGI
ncbi:VIT1/CCC1 transporter family protein [archaeon]|nr:VIT1/CCC1 transporter family protein [archaeon]